MKDSCSSLRTSKRIMPLSAATSSQLVTSCHLSVLDQSASCGIFLSAGFRAIVSRTACLGHRRCGHNPRCRFRPSRYTFSATISAIVISQSLPCNASSLSSVSAPACAIYAYAPLPSSGKRLLSSGLCISKYEPRAVILLELLKLKIAMQVYSSQRPALCSRVRPQAQPCTSARHRSATVRCAASSDNSNAAPTAIQTGKIGTITLTKDTESIADVMAFTGPAPEVSLLHSFSFCPG